VPGIGKPAAEHAGAIFRQSRVGLHHPRAIRRWISRAACPGSATVTPDQFPSKVNIFLIFSCRCHLRLLVCPQLQRSKSKTPACVDFGRAGDLRSPGLDPVFAGQGVRHESNPASGKHCRR
jgi:hypothetical protein